MMLQPTDSELYYLLTGVGASIMASIVKTISKTKVFTKMGFLKMVADAISCAILTLGISMSIHEYYGASLVYAVGIGAFVGSLGNTMIIEIASTLINHFLYGDKHDSK